jgi:hypothetical protein
VTIVAHDLSEAQSIQEEARKTSAIKQQLATLTGEGGAITINLPKAVEPIVSVNVTVSSEMGSKLQPPVPDKMQLQQLAYSLKYRQVVLNRSAVRKSQRWKVPTPPPTLLPTPAPTMYQARIFEDIPYVIANQVPYREDGFGGHSYSAYNLQTDSGASWLAPDQTMQMNKDLYLMLDMGGLHYVAELMITNCWDGSCAHYFVRDFLVSVTMAHDPANGSAHVVDSVSGSLQVRTGGEVQIVPVQLTGRYVRFVCLSYGVAPGLTKLFIMGNQVLKISSCSASTRIVGHTCEKAYDEIQDEKMNGFASNQVVPAWIIFQVVGAPTVSRIGLISGAGQNVWGDEVNDFSVELKTWGHFNNVTNLRFVHNIADGSISGNRATTCRENLTNDTILAHPSLQKNHTHPLNCSSSSNMVQLYFDYAVNVEAVKLVIYGGRSFMLNEIYIYRATAAASEAPTPTPTFACNARPVGWVSMGGSDCPTYYEKGYCTPYGGYGPGWMAAYGTFDLWATDGVSPLQACCGCGGGSNWAAEKAVDRDVRDASLGYYFAGDGYCGSSINEEIGNRMGPVNSTLSKEEVEEKCLRDPNCDGFHWNIEGGGSVMLSNVSGSTCCESIMGELCFKKLPQPCLDAPREWVSIGGSNCSRYVTEGYCNANGSYGAGWEPSFGTFSIWSKNGIHATQACCACGGGEKQEWQPTPAPTPKPTDESFGDTSLGPARIDPGLVGPAIPTARPEPQPDPGHALP